MIGSREGVAVRSLPDVGAGSVWGRFWSGAACAASGIGLTLRHRRLLTWSIVPMALQTVLFGALLSAGGRGIDDVVELLGPAPGQWYSFVGGVLYVALAVLLVIASVVGSIFLAGVLCDPLYDLLSEAAESALLGREVSAPFSASLVVTGMALELSATLWRLCIFAAGALALWLLGLTGVGAIVAVPLALSWSWLFVALAFLSRSMARHAIPGRGRMAALFDHKACALGFGAMGWLLSYLPLTAPFLIVGATRMYLALAAHDRVLSTLSDVDKRALRGSA